MATNKKTGKKKHLLYDFFNPSGNGKGVSKEEARKPRNVKYFFTLFFRNFNMMFALNVFAILGNFPLLFGLFALTGKLNNEMSAPASCLFPALYGTSLISGLSPSSLALFGVHGTQATTSFYTTATYVFLGISALVVFTWGIVNAATAYVMRNLTKGDPTTFVSDIRYSIKRNWKQALLFGVIDLLLLFVIAYDLLIFYLGTRTYSTFYSVLLGVMVIIALMYTIMRYYIYTMMVTFDLNIFKLFKNALIFAIIGFKRNIVALLGMALIAGLEALLYITIMPLCFALPVVILISLFNFTGFYAVYPEIKKVMIDPYYVSDSVGAKTREQAANDAPEELPEPVFRDRG